MTNAARKGRNFALYIHKQLRTSLPDLAIQNWSGTKEDPGDLYTRHLLFDCKHISNYSSSDVQRWYDKIEREAAQLGKHPVILLRRSGTQDIQVIFNIEHIPFCPYSGLARFYWDEGIKLLTFMESYYEEKKNLNETTTTTS